MKEDEFQYISDDDKGRFAKVKNISICEDQTTKFQKIVYVPRIKHETCHIVKIYSLKRSFAKNMERKIKLDHFLQIIDFFV